MNRLLLVLCLLVTPGFTYAKSCEPQHLDILLTNDDGYQTPAIRTLHHALIDAGHRVKRIAPDRNYSGSSASITFGNVTANKINDDNLAEVYAVSGSPGTTVLLGATAIFKPGELDLVISGINEGANLGPGTPMSGTVGATTVAAHALDPSIPAIAISTDLVNKPADSAENLAHYQDVSRFMVQLVEQLQLNACQRGSGLLPKNTALNVNYPPLAKEAIKGVKLAKQGQATYFSLGFLKKAGDGYSVTLRPVEPQSDIRDSDTLLFKQGFITIVPLDGDMGMKPDSSLRSLGKMSVTD